ncbi:hypothetical protein P3S67_006612 [Capsicum chacoense]
MNVERVKVALFWNDEIIHEGNTISYSISPKFNIKYPISIGYRDFVKSIFRRMKIKNDDFDLFIVGQYPNSFSSQELINYGEWIISDDELLTKFLRTPCDYASQIKLNILQIYIKKEWKNSSAHSPSVRSPNNTSTSCSVILTSSKGRWKV